MEWWPSSDILRTTFHDLIFGRIDFDTILVDCCYQATRCYGELVAQESPLNLIKGKA